MTRPKIFLDADVIFAGSAAPSTQGASYVILQMGEITLIDCYTSQQVIIEVQRNLTQKLPQAVAEFEFLVKRSVKIVSDPTLSEINAFNGQADPKDLPILVAVLQTNCSHLLTFNTRHFYPAGQITIQRPGDFLGNIRSQLSTLSDSGWDIR